MILVLSGEGPTDVGKRKPTEQGWEFVPGPMALIVDQLLERHFGLGYSLLEIHTHGGDCVFFLSEGDLKALRQPAIGFPRSGQRGTQYFRKSALELGVLAARISREKQSPVIAVLFRDADRTRSTTSNKWYEKFESIRSGFEDAGFPSGVPMVPKPKSEAWLLCGLRRQRNPGEDCAWLEDESGNDASPRSLKKRLADHLGHDPTAEEQAELVRSGQINPEKIDLPSFLAFRNALDAPFANVVTAR